MEKIWSYTIQLGNNMWRDSDSPPENSGPFQCQSTGHYHAEMLTDREVWRRVVDQLPSFGITMLVIDLGEGVRYETHPELAVLGAWTVEDLREELEHIRRLGMEPIPMLNFSSYHDTWLGQYGLLKGSETYNRVVMDLIHEVCEIFQYPRFFHLGMNEEELLEETEVTPWWRAYYKKNSVMRSEEEWYRDVAYYIECVETHGARPWIYSDYYWKHPTHWEKKLPKSCILSGWWFERVILDPNGNYPDRIAYQAFRDMHAMGYDQIPAASDFTSQQNIAQTVYLFMEMGYADEHLLGFNACPMQAAVDLNYYTLLNNANRLMHARRMFEDQKKEA